MKLYTYELAPNPRRVKLFLQYKGVELEKQSIDLGTDQQLSEEYRAINPACTVPVLQLEDGTVLTDCISICLYLESVYPDKALFGSTALEQAQVVGWTHTIFLEGLFSIANILRNQGEHFKDRAMPGTIDLEQIPALVKRGKDCLDGFFAKMELHLEGREFIVGDSLTMADIDNLVVCDFASWVKESIPADCSNLLAWYARVQKLLGEG